MSDAKNRGPTLRIVATCDNCEFHFVRPDGRRYCDAQDGRRMDHAGVSPDCPHLMTPRSMTTAAIVSALAAIESPIAVADYPERIYCPLCKAECGDHTAQCPWRMAREYIGASAPFR